MKYEILTTNEDGVKIYAKIDDDALIRITCIEQDPEYQAWLNQTKQSAVNTDATLAE